MNKEQAEIYVYKSLDVRKITSRNFQYKFLLLNMICLAISIGLYRSLTFIMLVSATACIDILFTILFAKKQPRLLKATILISIQLIIFCISLNMIIFSMYQLIQMFILWEFIVSIVIQLVAIAVSFIIVKKHANQFKSDGGFSKTEIIAGSISGFSYALGLILCKIFAPSISVVISIIALLINLLVCLMSVGVTAAMYRAYLIKCFDLNCSIDMIDTRSCQDNIEK